MDQLIIDAKGRADSAATFPCHLFLYQFQVPLTLHREFMLVDQQFIAFMCWKRFLLCYMLAKSLSVHGHGKHSLRMCTICTLVSMSMFQRAHSERHNSYSHFANSCSYQSTRNGHIENTSSSRTHHNRRRLCVGVVWLCV
jgi:hypothetical protein